MNTIMVNGEDAPLMIDDSGKNEVSTEEESDSGSEEDSDDSDYDSDDSGESEFDSSMEEMEAALRLGSRQNDMKRSLSSPAMAAVFANTNTKKERLPMTNNETIAGLTDLAARMKKSDLYMQAPVEVTCKETVEDPFAATDPDDFLQQILEGISAKSFPSDTWHDYFQTQTPEHVGAYTTEMVQAIRTNEYGYLRDRLRNGHTLQCCNTHGESILHLVCRRGSEDMLRFLMEEAEVSVRIRDDKGRTPFHDACWTADPKFPLVFALLESSPELLFVQDHRGHTPLSYIPRKCWGQWNGFLQKNRVFLRASVRSLRFDRAKYLVRSIVPCMK